MLYLLLYHFSECTIQNTCAWCRLNQKKDGALKEEEACHQLSVCQAALRDQNEKTVVITCVVILLLVIAICVTLCVIRRKRPQLLTTCWAGLRSLCCRDCNAEPKDEPAERQVPVREDDNVLVLQGASGGSDYYPHCSDMSQQPGQVQDSRIQEQDNRGFTRDSAIYYPLRIEQDAGGQQSPPSPARSPQGQTQRPNRSRAPPIPKFDDGHPLAAIHNHSPPIESRRQELSLPGPSRAVSPSKEEKIYVNDSAEGTKPDFSTLDLSLTELSSNNGAHGGGQRSTSSGGPQSSTAPSSCLYLSVLPPPGNSLDSGMYSESRRARDSQTLPKHM